MSNTFSERLLDPLNTQRVSFTAQEQLLRSFLAVHAPDARGVETWDQSILESVPKALNEIELLPELRNIAGAEELSGVRITGFRVGTPVESAFDAQARNGTYTIPTFVDISNDAGTTITDIPFADIPLMVGSQFELNYNSSIAEAWLGGVCPFRVDGYFVIEGTIHVLFALRRAVHNQPLYGMSHEENGLPRSEGYYTARTELLTKKLVVHVEPTGEFTIPFSMNTSKERFRMNALAVYRTFAPDLTTEDVIDRIIAYVPDPRQRSDVRVHLRRAFSYFRPDQLQQYYRQLEQPTEEYATRKKKRGAAAKSTATKARDQAREGSSRGKQAFEHYLQQMLFVNFNNLPEQDESKIMQLKLANFDYFLAGLVQYDQKRRRGDNLNDYSNIMVASPGMLYANLLASYVRQAVTTRDFVKRFVDSEVYTLQHLANELQGPAVGKIIGPKMARAVRGRWSCLYYSLDHVSQAVQTHAFPTQIISLVTQIKVPARPEGKQEPVREVSPSGIGFIAPGDTPEGHNCGLVLHTALTTMTSSYLGPEPSAVVYDMLQPFVASTRDATHTTLCFFNGAIIGWVDAEKTRNTLLQARRKGEIERSTTVALRTPKAVRANRAAPGYPELVISLEPGRVLRPLIIVKTRPDGTRYYDLSAADGLPEAERYQRLLENGDIELVSPLELEGQYVAYSQELFSALEESIKLRETQLADAQSALADVLQTFPEASEEVSAANYKVSQARDALRRAEFSYSHRTYVEIHPVAIASPLAATVNWGLDRTPGARLMVANNCARAALAPLASVFDPTHRLTIRDAVPPLVTTAVDDAAHRTTVPWNGATLNVAIIPDPETIEDAYVMSSAVQDAGAYNHQRRIEYTLGTASRQDTGTAGRMIVPKERNPAWVNSPADSPTRQRYSALDALGIITLGTVVDTDEILISAVRTVVRNGTEHVEQVDVRYEELTPGRVEEIIVEPEDAYETKNVTGVRIIIVAVSVPEEGDKYSSREGQKGVLAPIRHASEMPYALLPRRFTNAEGEVVTTFERLDIQVLANPLATYGRQTLGRIFEIFAGMAAVATGRVIRGTSFTYANIDDYLDILHAAGFDYGRAQGVRGYTLTVINPVTGRRYLSPILVGPLTFSALRQIASIQLSLRTGNRMNPVTGEPRRGFGGGLHNGEMELDVLMSTGVDIGAYIRYNSAGAYLYACRACGYLARNATEQCTTCTEPNSIRAVRVRGSTATIQYALLSQNVQMRVRMRDVKNEGQGYRNNL